MKAVYLDYILDCIIEKFLSIMSDKDLKEFESKYPDYTYNLGFKNAIKEWSINKVRREISLCRMIDLIEGKNMMNTEEHDMINIEENIIQCIPTNDTKEENITQCIPTNDIPTNDTKEDQQCLAQDVKI